jgi:hypothetical protein
MILIIALELVVKKDGMRHLHGNRDCNITLDLLATMLIVSNFILLNVIGKYFHGQTYTEKY